MSIVFKNFINRYFSSEESILLVIIILGTLGSVALFGSFLGPVFAAVVIAFLLQGVVNKFSKLGFSRTISVYVTFLLFLCTFITILVVVLPLAGKQMSLLVSEFPNVASRVRDILSDLPQQFGDYVTQEQLEVIMLSASEKIGSLVEQVFAFSISGLPSILAVGVYVLLVPVLVFFLLVDKDTLLNRFSKALPDKKDVLLKIWHEMDFQLANYIRGKAIEILIVGLVSYVAFSMFKLNYAALLAIAVGLSVLIPYIGALVVTIPVVLVGLLQWGYSPELFWLVVCYLAIQFLDGNILVPILFAEVVDLHPVMIVTAVLFFGGIWGFWGVFFAIPLATLIRAILNAWPIKQIG